MSTPLGSLEISTVALAGKGSENLLLIISLTSSNFERSVKKIVNLRILSRAASCFLANCLQVIYDLKGLIIKGFII